MVSDDNQPIANPQLVARLDFHIGGVQKRPRMVGTRVRDRIALLASPRVHVPINRLSYHTTISLDIMSEEVDDYFVSVNIASSRMPVRRAYRPKDYGYDTAEQLETAIQDYLSWWARLPYNSELAPRQESLSLK